MITPATLIITMDDCRKAGHCALGVRRWFGAHGLDFRSFLAVGIPAADLLATADGQGRQVVARAVRRRIVCDESITELEALDRLEKGIMTDG